MNDPPTFYCSYLPLKRSFHAIFTVFLSFALCCFPPFFSAVTNHLFPLFCLLIQINHSLQFLSVVFSCPSPSSPWLHTSFLFIHFSLFSFILTLYFRAIAHSFLLPLCFSNFIFFLKDMFFSWCFFYVNKFHSFILFCVCDYDLVFLKFSLFPNDLHNASKACKIVHPTEGALNEEVVWFGWYPNRIFDFNREVDSDEFFGLGNKVD